MKFTLLFAVWLTAAVGLVLSQGTRLVDVEQRLTGGAQAIVEDCVSQWPESCGVEMSEMADSPGLTEVIVAATSSVCDSLSRSCETAYFIHRAHGNKESAARIAEVGCVNQELHEMCSRAASELRDLEFRRRALRAASIGCALSRGSSSCEWQSLLESEAAE